MKRKGEGMISIFGGTADPSTLAGVLAIGLGFWYRLQTGMKILWYEWVIVAAFLMLFGGIAYIGLEDYVSSDGVRVALAGTVAFTLTEVLALIIDSIKLEIPTCVHSLFSSMKEVITSWMRPLLNMFKRK